MKIIGIHFFQYLSIGSGHHDCEYNNARKQNTYRFETFSKMLEKQNTLNVSKLSRIVESKLNLHSLKKQACSNTMLGIYRKLMKE